MNRDEYMRVWREKNKAKIHANWKRWYDKTRMKALLKIGNGVIACVRCGSKEMLEINHKNGGGNIERREKNMRGANIRLKVATGAREHSDLEILCRPCNLVHAAETLGGRKYTVTRID